MKKLWIIFLCLFSLLCVVGCQNDTEKFEGNEAEIYQLYKAGKKSNSSNGSKDAIAPGASSDMAPAEDSTIQAGETSKTTVHEEGVDEPYFVKNDSRYLYVSNQIVNSIIIYDTQEEQTVYYQLGNNGLGGKLTHVVGLFLKDTKLVIIYQSFTQYESNVEPDYNEVYSEPSLSFYYYHDSSTVVEVLDVTSPMEPTQIRYVTIENSISKEERMVDDILYMVLDTKIISKNNFVNPKVKDSSNREFSLTADLLDIAYGYSKYMYNQSATFFLSFDTSKDEMVSVSGMYGPRNEFYMTKDNLYIINTDYSGYLDEKVFGKFTFNQRETIVYRYQISGTNISYKGNIVLHGYLSNILAVSEYENVLRIALTGVDYVDFASKKSIMNNTLYTIDVSIDEMSILDSYSGFGYEESIYGVTYEKEKAFIVTYMSIDPLFEFDLSNPKDIKLIGQLEMPGVSDYLDYLGDSLVLGLGRETEEIRPGTAITKGIKLSLYESVNGELSEVSQKVFSDIWYSSSMCIIDYRNLTKLEQSLCYFLPIYYYDVNNCHSSLAVMAIQVDRANKEIHYLGVVDMQSLAYTVVINGKIFAIDCQNIYELVIEDSLKISKTIH